ncbi:hypothetical protein KC345_g10468 [Hortaea werneckii]|nr:hypothetical protein KC345_g10468 [Hortaea werneckii]
MRMSLDQRTSLFVYEEKHEEKFKDQLLNFRLPPEQAEFTGLPEQTLQDACEDPCKMGVVIAQGERAIGFFVLHTGEGIADFFQDHSGAVLLRAFLLDYASQGRGFAKAAMNLLPDFVRAHYPEAQQIVLAVNERNLPAGQLTLLMEIFKRARELGPFPYYIGAGCLVQTVWNELTGREPGYGIDDIDIIYYDGEDLSYAAEDQMITVGRVLFAGLPVPVDLKNQARVHLWYRDKFGIELTPYASLEDAINSWPTTVTSLAARLGIDGDWQIYAPFGLEDLFQLILRPNKALISEDVYLNKTQKWKNKWPELTVVPWGQ